MGAVVAAVIARKERLVVEAFERARAMSPDTARTPADLGVEPYGIGWERLRSRAVIRDAGDGRAYLDVEVWQAVRRMRRRMAAVMILIVVVMVAVVAILASQRAQ